MANKTEIGRGRVKLHKVHHSKAKPNVSPKANSRNKSINLKVDPRDPNSVNNVVNEAVSWYQSYGVAAPVDEIRQTAQSAVHAYNNGNQTRAFIDWFKPCPCGSGHGKCAGQRTIGNPGPMGHQWNMSVCIGLISSINVY